MYHIEVMGLKWCYLVGVHNVGIVSPTRKSYVRRIDEISGRPANSTTGIKNGTADSRLTPEEVISYVLEHKLT